MREIQILFLCLGNTCRSPMAEFICKRLVEAYTSDSKYFHNRAIKIVSAGFYVELGSTLNAYAMQCLQENGFQVAEFTTKQVGHELLEKSDIIICMTKRQKELLNSAYDRYSANEVLLSSYDLIGKDIDDPLGEGIEAYRQVYQQIEEVCQKLLQNLENYLQANKILIE